MSTNGVMRTKARRMNLVKNILHSFDLLSSLSLQAMAQDTGGRRELLPKVVIKMKNALVKPAERSLLGDGT